MGRQESIPDDELLVVLAESIELVRAFLDERSSSLNEVIERTGFERNAAIVACKEAANEDDVSRKRFEVMCREVFRQFKAALNVAGVNDHRKDRDAINIVYKILQRDREQANIAGIMRQLQEVVDEVIYTIPASDEDDSAPYNISHIDFEKLKEEFAKTPRKKTTVQNLRHAVETRLQKLLEKNPLRIDFVKHYEKIVTDYNFEKDRVTIEQTFEELLRFVQTLDEEESRAVQEWLDEETLAVFDLLKKPELNAGEIKAIKAVASELLAKLKAEKLQVDQWRDKETTRDAVRTAIHDFLYSDDTGLPLERYDEQEVMGRAEEVYRHVYRVYPEVPSPFYGATVAS